MIYLTGAMSQHSVQANISSSNGRLGAMLSPQAGNRLAALQHYSAWAADNGCYTKGDSFNLQVYLDWLQLHTPAQDRCLFATAPDVVGNAQATWERSCPVLPTIRAMGYKAALVAQNGIQDMEIEWGAFDVLFIGGTTGWKLSSAVWELVREARARGKWVHMGRVNSEARLRTALFMGCQSVDGTYVKYGPDKLLSRLQGWLAGLDRVSVPDERQGVMEL